MIDLGTLGGSGSFAAGVSDNGQVVGYSSMPVTANATRSCGREAGGMVDLGTPRRRPARRSR